MQFFYVDSNFQIEVIKQTIRQTKLIMRELCYNYRSQVLEQVTGKGYNNLVEKLGFCASRAVSLISTGKKGRDTGTDTDTQLININSQISLSQLTSSIDKSQLSIVQSVDCGVILTLFKSQLSLTVKKAEYLHLNSSVQ